MKTENKTSARVLVLTALLLSSCTVYQSPDRGTFDQNAVSGAPKQAALFQPLQKQAAEIGASACQLFGYPMSENASLMYKERGASELMIASPIQHSRLASSIVCTFALSRSQTPKDPDLGITIARARFLVEQLVERLGGSVE